MGETVYLSTPMPPVALSGYQAVQPFGAADPDVPFARYVTVPAM